MKKSGNTEKRSPDIPKSEPLQQEKASDNIGADSGKVQIVHSKQGIWKTYDITDGLPSGVECLLQDREGYIWLGTGAGAKAGTGLCRYNGAEFTIYKTDDGLVDNHVNAICEDHEGRLWLGTSNGISCYDGQKFANYTTDDGLANDWILSICEDSRGLLWFGTQAGLSCFDGKNFTNYTTEDGLVSDYIGSVFGDRRGQIWFGVGRWQIDGQGVVCFDGQNFTNYTTDDGLADNRVSVICEDHHGRLWFGTWGGGVSCFDGNEFVNYTTEDGLADNRVPAICEGHHGRMWFGTWGGVSCFDGYQFINYTFEDGLLDNRVRDIMQDREGLLWFAHIHSGLSRFDGETMQTLAKAPIAETLIQDKKGRIWFGNNNLLYGISLHMPNSIQSEQSGQHEIGQQQCCRSFGAYLHSLMEDSKGNLWVGTQGDGLYWYESTDAVWNAANKDSKCREKHFTKENGLSSNDVSALLEARDGTIWAGTRGNPACLSGFDGESFSMIPTPHPIISRLFEDSQGRIWMGGWDGVGLSCYDGEKLTTYNMADGLPDDNITSIVEDDTGNLWIGTHQGLCRFDGREFRAYGEEQGLLSPYHQTSAKDVNGQLWFGVRMGGVYRYDGRYFQRLTIADGLPSNSITKLIPQADGSMIIGTYHGVLHYQPSSNIPPGVEIREVVADQVYQNPAELELTTTGAALLTIHYHGLNFATSQMRYSYNLEGYDEEWQGTWESQVRYERLPLGEYTFRVTAISRDFTISESPAELKLKIIPDPRDLKVDKLESDLRAKNYQLEFLHLETRRKYQFENIIGDSEAIKWVLAMMDRAIDSGMNVLITGETGTGKELVAKGIHYNSPRKDRLPIPYDCGSVSKELIASQLFGYRKGAFTGANEDRVGLFEAAKGSTVILDEIGNMPLDVQSSLLRVLEERKVQRLGDYASRDIDVRVIAITNKDLLKEVEENRFREDLYYRLDGFHIYIPPLRERPSDIPQLAEHFYQEACQEQKKELRGFAPGILDKLALYSWPGNVRELKNEVCRACALAEEGAFIQSHHLSADVIQNETIVQEAISGQVSYVESVKQFRRRLIEDALRKCNGNRTRAAKLLKMNRPNMVHLIKNLGIEE